ncbi:MAG: hypothetical protein KDB21_10090 [Acidimicrobiales bacterium]|nr:hypothetical protein [Acidimicrobiales bacterium]
MELAADGDRGAGPATITYAVNGETTVITDQLLPWSAEIELPDSFDLTLEVNIPSGMGGAWCIIRGLQRRAIDAKGEEGARCEASGSASGDTLSIRSETAALGGEAMDAWEHPDGIVTARMPHGWELQEFEPVESGVDVYIVFSDQSYARNLSYLAALIDPDHDRDALRIMIDAHPEAPTFDEWRTRFEQFPPVDWISVESDTITIDGHESTRYRGPVSLGEETVDTTAILVPVDGAVVFVLGVAGDEDTGTVVEDVIASLAFDETAISELRAAYG